MDLEVLNVYRMFLTRLEFLDLVYVGRLTKQNAAGTFEFRCEFSDHVVRGEGESVCNLTTRSPAEYLTSRRLR